MRTVCLWELSLAVTAGETTPSPLRRAEVHWRQAGAAIIIKALMEDAMPWKPGTQGTGGDCVLVSLIDSFITWAGWYQWPRSVR